MFKQQLRSGQRGKLGRFTRFGQKASILGNRFTQPTLLLRASKAGETVQDDPAWLSTVNRRLRSRAATGIGDKFLDFQISARHKGRSRELRRRKTR